MWPLRRYRKIGVWDRIFEAVSAAYDGDLQMIDTSSMRVHQHGAKKRGLQDAPARDGADARCMGRSLGGLAINIQD